MIVVDTQVIVYAAIEGAFTELVTRVASVDSQWAAPPLWRSEFRSVLAGEVRRGVASVAEALDAAYRAELLLAAEVVPDMSDVLALVTMSPCSAYDLEFVAVAQSLGVPLVTNDRQILESFPAIAVSLESFAARSA